MKNRRFLLLCCLSIAACLTSCSKKVKEADAQPSATAALRVSPPPSSSAYNPLRNAELCKKCRDEETSCREPERQCSSLEGVAKDGPGKGIEKKKLCEEARACAERTGCADSHESFCFCGDAGCMEKGANGPCMKELMAAFESTDTMAVGARYGDRQYAGGKAMGHYTCLNHRCKVPCDY